MRLRTDFSDRYDSAFHGHWRLDQPEYVRMAETSRTRKEDHDLLEDVGFKVPPRGICKDLAKSLEPTDSLVVYTSPTKHRAEGKIIATANSLYAQISESYACKWIGRVGVSIRLLAVGKRIFWMVYKSKLSPFSNVDTDTIDAVVVYYPWQRQAELDLLILQKRLKEPLVAVDLVLDGMTGYAIDLNTAPGLAWTPVIEMLTYQEIHDLIEARWKELRA